MSGRFVYFHGFASGPQSRKARFFQQELDRVGIRLETPDLSAGDFEQLTIGGQLAVAEELLRGEPATLIGSSLGGYLAALYASRHPETKRLILLAPAFHFSRVWERTIGAEALRSWRETGTHYVYHYGEARMRELAYGIVEESRQWDPAPAFTQQGHIFHGLRDTVVPILGSQEYVMQHPHVYLSEIDSGHELTDALETIWDLCYFSCSSNQG